MPHRGCTDDAKAPGQPEGWEYALAGALGLASFGLYLLTLCPTVFWYDRAEYAAA